MPKLASKAWIPIRDDNFREAVYSEDIFNEDLSIFHGGDLLFASSEVHHFGQFVNEDHNGRESI